MTRFAWQMAMALALLAAEASAAGTIRVGTTGDYRPLTWFDPATGQFVGRDIDLVKAFARSKGLKLEFVRTSWPTLMSDLEAGKFDMAVGGISRTKQRSADALASVTIERSGKTALVRCSDLKRFSTLADIDQKDVTVVENPGGTNEKFAQANLHQATLIVVSDNKHPFEYLMTNRADVFFTDAIEAVYAQGLDKGLCAVNPQHPFTKIDKVFLFAKSETVLRDSFDEWFASRHD